MYTGLTLFKVKLFDERFLKRLTANYTTFKQQFKVS